MLLFISEKFIVVIRHLLFKCCSTSISEKGRGAVADRRVLAYIIKICLLKKNPDRQLNRLRKWWEKR